MTQPLVAYTRVSSRSQGVSGLGLDAQRAAVLAYAKGEPIAAEFTEVESGRKSDRAQLKAALAFCKAHGAMLVIAKLDRLARNVAFISRLMESGVEFTAVDFPNANRLTVHILAAVAEHEAELISTRTKAALAVAKARGRRVGGGNHTKAARAAKIEKAAGRNAEVRQEIEHIRSRYKITSLSGIAYELNRAKIKTARGGTWSAMQVSRVLAA